MSHQCSSMFPSQIRRLHVLHVRTQAPRSYGRNIWNTQTRVSSVRSANDGASSVADRDRVATMARVGSAVQGRGNIPTMADILLLARSATERAAQWENPEPAEGAGKRSRARPHIPGRDEGCARASTPASTAHAAFDRSRTPPRHSARGVGRRLADSNLGAESGGVISGEMSEPASGRASPTLGDRLTDDFNKVRICSRPRARRRTHARRAPSGLNVRASTPRAPHRKDPFGSPRLMHLPFWAPAPRPPRPVPTS